MTTLREAAQRALEALDYCIEHSAEIVAERAKDRGQGSDDLQMMMVEYLEKHRCVITTLRAALAEQDDDLTAAWMAGAAEGRKRAEQPQPVAYTGWRPISEPYEPTDELDIMLGDGSILCAVLPQFDGDLWWGGDGTGEKFIDPKYANVTHWRLHATAPVVPQPLTDKEILSVVGWERAEMYMKLAPNFPVEEARKETLKNARAVEAEVLKRVGVGK